MSISRHTYPFAAIVGQEKMKTGLILTIVNPSLSGILIRGEKGSAKSTAVRGLADILPLIETVRDCPFQLAPEETGETCEACSKDSCRERVLAGNRPETQLKNVRVVELPIGATEDRVVGTLDLENALRHGHTRYEPGILAAAHRGILYVDEINLLEDHVVDVLLDSAAMGVNYVERESISFCHPARFTLVGTMNPEEGELRPQLLDRFGLCVSVEGERHTGHRVEIMERRLSYEENPAVFCEQYAPSTRDLSERITTAMALYKKVVVSKDRMFDIVGHVLNVGVDGHRADLSILKAAKTLAAWRGAAEVCAEDLEEAAKYVLPHRIRRHPLQNMTINPKELFGQNHAAASGKSGTDLQNTQRTAGGFNA
jgi:magnesium chelatase subunit I